MSSSECLTSLIVPQVLYYQGDPRQPVASRRISRDLHCSWRMEWRHFLDVKKGRRCDWTFPYPPNRFHTGATGDELLKSDPVRRMSGRRMLFLCQSCI